MIDPESIVIREERFVDCWEESAGLRAEHAEEVGPREGVKLDVNAVLLQRLDEIGALQIMTLRSNGRIFGYLVTVISPSMEEAGMLVGVQTAFFVSKGFRGAGMRLQRASIEGLKAKGIGEVLLRAGVRGSGPKLGAMYTRLGAKDFGHMYNLMLKEA